jgi:NAD(P)-dependent dehydrogenase (short-subunit alcohol dehydrogenase family)
VDIGGLVAVITGGGSGIGRAMALALAREGARGIAIGDLDDEGGAETVRLVSEAGSKGLFVHTDVTDATAYAALLDRAIAQYSRLDILCNNAGIGEPGDLFEEDADPAAFERLVEINLTAVIRGTRLGVQKMSDLGRGGVIVNTASMGGFRPMPTAPVYAATKAGVINFTRSLAHLHGEYNIRVNAICPSFVDTPLIWRDGPERVQALTAQLGLLEPSLIAEGLLQLVKDDDKAGAIMRVTSQRGIDYAREITP